MTKRILIIVAALAGVGLLVAGVAAAYVFRTPATPSGALTAIPVQATNTTAVQETATAAGATQAPLPSGIVVAEVVQSESQVRFIIDEVLNGQPKSVVGVTDQVAAQILIDTANPANVQMGVIQVNARTLVTDNDFRNRALQNEILQTGLYEFITFTPRSFIGLPATGAVGDTFVFQIVGDLTVRDVTREVIFDVTVTIDSSTQMHGLARAVISRENFGLGLIDLPRQVASVKDAVTLELEFVARAVE